MTNGEDISPEEEEELLARPRTHGRAKEGVLTREEDRKFKLACLSNPRLAPRRVFMYACMGVFGMRVSEMCHIQSSWFDASVPGEEYIRIPREQPCDCYTCRRKAVQVWRPKTKAGARVIPGRIDIDLFRAMHTYVVDAKVRLQSGERKRDPVPRIPHKVWEEVSLIGRLAGIEKRVFPHALRATAATKIAQIPGMTAAQLMYIMGWSRIETANEYIRMAGSEVLSLFKPSEETLEEEHYLDKRFHELLGFAISPATKPGRCPVCESEVLVAEDGSWDCPACGATSRV